MANKPALNIAGQIALLKQRGMLFKNEAEVSHFLKNISYYRLKGYWWDMQADVNTHNFKPGTYFEDVINLYNFDRHLRLILFDAIERIEIALRTKMVYHFSVSYGGLWYLNGSLFANQGIYQQSLTDLQKEFDRSQEIFIKDQKHRFPSEDVDAWKILEIASMGTLSKLYKNIVHQLPEKSAVAREMGLNLHSEISSWLEAITYVRNITAHHSRLWSRNMVKRPIERLNNPSGNWFSSVLLPVQSKKPFLIISCMLYLCNAVTPNHHLKAKLLKLFADNPTIPIYKLGFLNNWNNQPLWR